MGRAPYPPSAIRMLRCVPLPSCRAKCWVVVGWSACIQAEMYFLILCATLHSIYIYLPVRGSCSYICIYTHVECCLPACLPPDRHFAERFSAQARRRGVSGADGGPQAAPAVSRRPQSAGQGGEAAVGAKVPDAANGSQQRHQAQAARQPHRLRMGRARPRPQGGARGGAHLQYQTTPSRVWALVMGASPSDLGPVCHQWVAG